MDLFAAYLLICIALGALRLVQGWRWTGGRQATVRELWFWLDALWAVASAYVLVLAPSPLAQGVALWFVLGTLAGWLLWRTAQPYPPAYALGKPLKPGELPEWYQEFLMCCGLGLAFFAAIALARYVPPQPMSVANFVLTPVGAIALLLLVTTAARTTHHLITGYVQRALDRGALSGLRGHPQCNALFGDIHKLILKPEESARTVGEGVRVYRVVGSRAAGVVVAEFSTGDQTTSELVQGLVYMDSGERSTLNVRSGRKAQPIPVA